MNLRNKGLLSGVLLLLFFPASVVGDSLPRDHEEIDHLLGFIEHSDCTFFRNNSSYSGARAREHIQKKYNYIKKRKTGLTAEQFIKYAASRSSLSQKPYRVYCGAEPVSSEKWLLDELERYRRSSTLDASDVLHSELEP